MENPKPIHLTGDDDLPPEIARDIDGDLIALASSQAPDEEQVVILALPVWKPGRIRVAGDDSVEPLTVSRIRIAGRRSAVTSVHPCIRLPHTEF